MHALSTDLEGLRTRLRDALLGAPRSAAVLTELESAHEHERLVAAAASVLAEPVWGDVDFATLHVGLVTGSGGVALRTVNVSTAAALTACGVEGVRLVKCGSRSSRAKGVGPVGVLGAIGLLAAASPSAMERRLERHGFALLDSNDAFPWLHDDLLCTFPFLVEAREHLRFDPVHASWKVNGVATLDAVEGSLHGADARRTTVVTGATDLPGLRMDDASTAGTTTIVMSWGTRRTEAMVEPEAFGLARVSARAWRVPATLDAATALWTTLEGNAPRAWTELVAAAAAVIVATARPEVTIADACRETLDRLEHGAPARALVAMVAEEDE